ncbi:MAG: DUF1015 domain-containing protein [archaeon]|nr:DUF1015 domain-containing protein [archaeon]
MSSTQASLKEKLNKGINEESKINLKGKMEEKKKISSLKKTNLTLKITTGLCTLALFGLVIVLFHIRAENDKEINLLKEKLNSLEPTLSSGTPNSALGTDTKILLPNEEKVDLPKWPVVACDQFTSQPEYWESVSKIVGDKPSTLKMIYPEVYLNEEKSKKNERINNICKTMKEYQKNKIFKEVEGPIFVERTFEGKVHLGLVTTVNLEDYLFTQNAQTLIRPTEQTILERLPPRMDIRRDAIIESPHILLLMDDIERTVLEPLEKQKDKMKKIYDVDLMMDGGKIVGYTLPKEMKDEVFKKIAALASDEVQKKKYGKKAGKPLLFAVGDGNHSLATAKSIWEERKKKGEDPKTSPGRFALVEIQNVHDDALDFEPIHRVFDGPNANKMLDFLKKEFNGKFKFTKTNTPQEALKKIIEHGNEKPHTFAYISKEESGTFSIIEENSNSLVVASIQPAIDKIVKENKIGIDYVHDDDVVIKLGSQEGHSAIMLPAMKKEELFKTVVEDGLVPRKTFSMGSAKSKRYYMECRQIKN